MWEIEVTPEFDLWFECLGEEEQCDVRAAVDLLEERGPSLGRPKVDTLTGTAVPNLKELRVRSLRVLFAFDPRRVGILLLGGDKRNSWTDWYRDAIPQAERLWQRHLDELKGEGEIFNA
jgi:hypothetical protein